MGADFLVQSSQNRIKTRLALKTTIFYVFIPNLVHGQVIDFLFFFWLIIGYFYLVRKSPDIGAFRDNHLLTLIILIKYRASFTQYTSSTINSSITMAILTILYTLLIINCSIFLLKNTIETFRAIFEVFEAITINNFYTLSLLITRISWFTRDTLSLVKNGLSIITFH